MGNLTHYQKQVLMGLLIGNLSLQTFNKGKTYRLRFIQSELRKDYLFHLYGIFENFVNPPPKEIRDYRTSGAIYKRWYFNTITSLEFNFFVDLFFEENKKVIKLELLNLIERPALAYWFMDNGAKKSKNCKGFRFCTDCYRYSEVLILQTSIVKQRETFRIYVKAESHQSLVFLIRDFLINNDSMKNLVL